MTPQLSAGVQALSGQWRAILAFFHIDTVDAASGGVAVFLSKNASRQRT
jgi:hypothetical protein